MKVSDLRRVWLAPTSFLVVAVACASAADVSEKLVTVSSQAIRQAARVRSEPEYPAAARQFRITGEVVAEFTVGLDGKVESVEITKGSKMLNPAVLSAVKKWSFNPFTADGHPIKVKSALTFTFKL